MKNIEENMQIQLVNWLHRTYPELWEATHHSPNGGHRHKAVANKMKLMGTKRGFPDLVTFFGRGLAMELKAPGGKARPEQKAWLRKLQQCGFETCVVDDMEKAKSIFERYANDAKVERRI